MRTPEHTLTLDTVMTVYIHLVKHRYCCKNGNDAPSLSTVCQMNSSFVWYAFLVSICQKSNIWVLGLQDPPSHELSTHKTKVGALQIGQFKRALLSLWLGKFDIIWCLVISSSLLGTQCYALVNCWNWPYNYGFVTGCQIIIWLLQGEAWNIIDQETEWGIWKINDHGTVFLLHDEDALFQK